ncbi:MAG: hypothetical protein AB4426_28555 [Xenococcaceae cyanobacterium]
MTTETNTIIKRTDLLNQLLFDRSAAEEIRRVDQLWLEVKADRIRIGVVGYSMQMFEQDRALSLIRQGFDSIEMAGVIEVVSGLTRLGIPALAYEEAVRRGWKTVGVACSKAFEYECFPVDETIIVGDEWGDESQTFLDMIDVLVRIGGGLQAHRECFLAKKQGKQVIEFELPTLVNIKLQDSRTYSRKELIYPAGF